MRLIDADALKEQAYPFPCAIGVEHAVTIRAINDAPTIDAVPVAHARWEYKFGSYSTPKCSCCGWNIPYSEDSRLDARNYCPNCGAKMDGGASDV